jgi:hypothetical protein
MEMSGEQHAQAVLPPGKELRRMCCIGGTVDPRAGLDAVEKRNIFAGNRTPISHSIIAISTTLSQPLGVVGTLYKLPLC